MTKITAKLLDSVLEETFATEVYSELTRARTIEIADAVTDSPQAAFAVIALMKRRLPQREAELCTALAMGISAGLALGEKLAAEEGKVPVQ